MLDYIEHIVKVVGVNYVGFGADIFWCFNVVGVVVWWMVKLGSLS